MGDERLTEGSICDINVAYNSKRVGYTTSMSYMNEINKISPLTLRNFAYLADIRFSSVTQMPSALRISAVQLYETCPKEVK
jgi:hypothetical protein